MYWPQAGHLDSDCLVLEPLIVDHAIEMLTALAPWNCYRFTGDEPPTLDELNARYVRQSRGSPRTAARRFSCASNRTSELS